MATCTRRQNLHDALVSPRGKKYFTKTFQIPALNSVRKTSSYAFKRQLAIQGDRRGIFHSLLRDRHLVVDRKLVSQMVRLTRGFVVGDLVRLVDRLCFIAGDLSASPSKRI